MASKICDNKAKSRFLSESFLSVSIQVPMEINKRFFGTRKLLRLFFGTNFLVFAPGADPYFTVECEGEKVRSHTVFDSLNPEWNASVTFYRKNTNSDIRIEVFDLFSFSAK